jgi:HD-like signal output (HDOD) protein
VYLAGLIHNIGFLVLDYIAPELSDQLYKRLAAEPKSDQGEVEEELLGTSHGKLGALLAQHWNLPEHIVSSLNGHDAAGDRQSAAMHPLRLMANLAEKLLSPFCRIAETAREISGAEWDALGIDPLMAGEIRDRVAKLEAELYIS